MTEPFPDPALDVIGAYLKAFLIRYLGKAWGKVAGNEPIVKHVFTHDPEHYVFDTKQLPCLYVFSPKSAGKPERTAEDWRILSETVKVYWLLPNAKQEWMPHLARAMPLVGEAIDRAVERNRDPCYIVAGDPDPSAPYEGSVVTRHAGLLSWECQPWLVGRVAIRSPGSMRGEWIDVGLFEGLQTEIIIKKRSRDLLGADPDHPEWGEFAGNTITAPSQLSLSINNGAAEAAFLVGYTMLYVQDGITAQVLGTTPAKLEAFTAAGQAVGVVADFAADKITIQSPGPYNFVVALSLTGTEGRKVKVHVRKNGVPVDAAPGVATLTGGTVVLALCGQIPGCAEGDELTLFAEADQAATSLTTTNGTFAVTRI